MPETNELSERELEILRLVATGASNKEIAQKLTISTNTVKVHLRNIFSKIGVLSRTEAAMYAVKSGMVPSFKISPEVEDEAIETSAITKNTEVIANRLRRLYLIFSLVIVFLVIGTFIAIRSINRSTATAGSAGLSQGQTQKWQPRKDMPTPRFAFGLTALDGMIYAVGGETGDGVTGVLERYDPAQDRWISLSEKPTKVADVSAAVIGGKIYVPGGRLVSGEISNILEIYNPREDRWTRGEDIPEPSSGYAMASYEGKLYLFGGWNGTSYLSSVYEYDPDFNQWNRKSPLSKARAFASAIEMGGKIYLMGGFDGKDALSLNETYSPSLDDGSSIPWQPEKQLPSPRFSMGIANSSGIIYLVGGRNQKDPINRINGYFIPSGEWKELQIPMDKGWSQFGVIGLGTNIYAMGGKNNELPTGKNLTYQVVYITVLPIVK